MARVKQYLEQDVLEMARQRIAHVFDTFDSIVVMFSGGKDSLVVLELVRQEAERRGQPKVHVVFRDEELIPNSVIDFVASYKSKPWCDLRWLVMPFRSDKFILGQHVEYVQWDSGRPWVRQPPEFAEVHNIGGQVMSQYDMDGWTAKPYPGKVAFMLGIRASESLTRFRSVVNKLNENYICACECDRVKIVKPIYDWEENDIFKFFHDERLPYCELYDWQHLDGTALRVATPLHSEASKTIDRWRRLDPDFYQRVMAVFPEMAVQERYWNDYDRYKLIEPYKGRGWEGVEAYIDEHVEDGTMREQCLDRLREFKSLGERQADTYNPDFLLKCIVSGSIKRTIIGSRKK